MDLKNTAMKFFNSNENPDAYTGPYVVRPGSLDLLLRTPHSYDDAVEYADRLMDGCALMLDLGSLDNGTRIRVFDYLNGVAYVVNAKASKVTDTMLLYTPARVSVEKQPPRKSSWLGR